MDKPVKFENPPIVEVVCGVLFSSQSTIQTAHIGAFWESVRNDFPITEDAPPLLPVLEESGPVTVASFELSELPPLRRTWMASEDGRTLIQVQQDRFLFNWKRISDDDAYPSYQVVIKRFEDCLARFVEFCSSVGVGSLAYRQYELTYVNHIGQGNGLDRVGLDALFVDHIRKVEVDRFLPPPDAIGWTSVYSFPNDQGRLHVAMQSAQSQQPSMEKIIRLDLTARGISSDTTELGRSCWFNMAHDWITRGFADITNPILHDDHGWRRTS
ncbi:TIGR04255 family protein [Vogesella oryzae]|uniref:TIGR04255 family protein n=1 Tax=Vogesella oryzae TaxID=1735285 RepID=UPI001583C2E2|nr:TIGR04255 family protein [Vogesella oryzae]